MNGTGKIENGDREKTANTYESTFIPADHRHQHENLTDLPLVMIEVQCGGYLGEDDIVQFNDKYGRVSVVTG